MLNCKNCKSCKVSKELQDFLMNSADCYKCVYQAKTKKSGKKERLCKSCEAPLISGSRWCYCNEECAALGKKNNKYWTTGVHSLSNSWKNRFNFGVTRVYSE